MLILPIKKKWFDMIKAREKLEEYREIKPYYTSRFIHHLHNTVTDGFDISRYGHIILRNGYSNNSPSIECYVRCYKGYGKKEWGAEPNKEYYVLEILQVNEVD